MEIVRYWWTHDGDEEVCYLNKVLSQGDIRCEHCGKLLVAGEPVCELIPLRKVTYYFDAHIQPEKYIECEKCADKRVEKVPGRNSIKYEDLIGLLKSAERVEEINKVRYEIGGLIPAVYIMFGYNQQNSAHQYDLWEHCLHTVLNLPRNLDDDMLYLAALLHDVGKSESWCWGKREDDKDMHYYGHPVKSMEIVRDEVIPCLKAAGVKLSEDDKKRLLYYVEYRDYRMSHREKHLKKHLSMVSTDEFKNLMLLEIADANAHVMIPLVLERIKVCEACYNRVM